MVSILAVLYPISFAVALFSLIFWFFFKNNKRNSQASRNLFFVSILLYLGVVLFSSTGMAGKMVLLSRDLIVMGLIAQFFNYFRSNKILFFGLLASLLFVFQAGYFKYLQQSFKQGKLFPKEVEYNGSHSFDHLDENGELFVALTPGTPLASLTKQLDIDGLTAELAFSELQSPEDTDLDDYYVVNIPKNKVNSIPKIKESLLDMPFVLSVEGNEILQLTPVSGAAAKIPKRKYNVNDPEIHNLWGFDKMNLDELFKFIRDEKVKPKRKAVVAILDTGVDSNHEDIKANYKSISTKYDKDPHSHGTHCAGIAGAVSNNKKGIASFAPDNGFIQITSVKVLNSWGMGTQRSIINGILKAADNGADVLSLSLGGPSDDKKQRAYNKAIQYANNKGAIVVVAAGNENINATERSPANAKGVITVSAVDQELNKASFSNFVTDINMGIAAPGVNIYSTIPDNKYAFYNGTSMATPYVAGLLGMLKSIDPDLDTKEAFYIINRTGQRTNDHDLTGKLIQPAAAIKEVLKKK